MVTDAAGTGFEIKKPHKGTETCTPLFFCHFTLSHLKLRNPIRGRKRLMPFFNINLLSDLKLRNPIRGRKLLQSLLLVFLLNYLKLRNPIRGRKPIIIVYRFKPALFEIKKPHKGTETVISEIL